MITNHDFKELPVAVDPWTYNERLYTVHTESFVLRRDRRRVPDPGPYHDLYRDRDHPDLDPGRDTHYTELNATGHSNGSYLKIYKKFDSWKILLKKVE